MSYDATNYNPDDEEQQQGSNAPVSQGAAPNTAPTPSDSGVITGVAQGAGTGKAAGSSSPAPTHSGNWTNINSYLDNINGQQFGQKFAGNLQNEVNSANQAQTTADTGFKGAVDSGSVTYDPTLVASAIANPTDFVNNASDMASWGKMQNASYSGPTDITQTNWYNPAQNATQNAYQDTQAAQTEGGRQGLLQKFFGNPNYTNGDSALDDLVLENSGAGGQALQNAINAGNQSNTNWSNILSGDNTYAGNAQTNTNAVKGQLNTAMGTDGNGNLTGSGAIGNFQTGLNNKVAQDNSTAASDYNTLVNDLRSGDVSSQDWGYLNGATAGERMYNVDPTQYVTQAPTANIYNDSSSQDYATAAALAKLAGVTNTFLPDADKGQANSWSVSPKFDSTGFQNAVNQGAAAYTQDMNAPSHIGYDLPGLDPNSPGGVLTPTESLAQAYQWTKNPNPPGPDYTPDAATIQNIINQYNSVQDKDGWNNILGQAYGKSTKQVQK